MGQQSKYYKVLGQLGFQVNPGNSGVGHLWIKQELQVWILLWKRDDSTPSYTKYIHIVEYFHVDTGGHQADGHSWPIDRSLIDDEGYCAFRVYVFATLQAGTVNKDPGREYGYTSATQTINDGPATDFDMHTSRDMGGTAEIPDPDFVPLSYPSYYSYMVEGNWCSDASLLSDWNGKCPRSPARNLGGTFPTAGDYDPSRARPADGLPPRTVSGEGS
jgi:hypothetical protein